MNIHSNNYRNVYLTNLYCNPRYDYVYVLSYTKSVPGLSQLELLPQVFSFRKKENICCLYPIEDIF